MKKVITMLLIFAIAISGIAVPMNKANAQMTIGFTPVETERPAATAEPAVVPTVAPTEEPEEEEEEVKQRKLSIHVVSYGNVIDWGATGAKRGFYYRDGSTIEMTKGFTETINISTYKKAVKWFTDNPEILTVTAKTVNEKKGKTKGCIVKAKKYGKAKLTAEYNGQTTTVTVKVVKNEFSCKIKDLPEFNTAQVSNKLKVEGVEIQGATSVKYDKKGNLVVKYYEEYKPNKYGKIVRYRSVPSYNNVTYIKINDAWGKTILKYGKKHGNGKTLSTQHPKYKETFVIPKKKLNGKKIDLRNVFYDCWRYCNVSCSDALKRHK